MNPSILFLNGPENEAKKQLCKMLQKKLNDNVCVYFNRKTIIKMFNVDIESGEDSYEWIIQKLLKTFVLNGVVIIFDGFLPTRRINQYVESLNGLSSYWIGVFFKDKSDSSSQEFYDFSVILDEELMHTQEEKTQEEGVFLAQEENVHKIQDVYQTQAESIYEFISKNDPICFPSTKTVEHVARKRTINRNDSKDRVFIKTSFEDDEAFSSNEKKEEDFQIGSDFESSNDEKKSFRSDKRSFGDNKDGESRPFRSDRRSFGDNKDGESRPFRSDRRSFGDNKDGESRPFRSDRRSFADNKDGESRPFRSDRRSFTDNKDGASRPFRSDRRSFGDNKDGASRPFRSDRRSFDDNKDGASRPFRSDRRSFGDNKDGASRPFRSDRRSFGDNKDGASRPFRSDRRSFGDNKDGASRPFRSDRRSFADNKDGASRPFRSDRRSFGDNKDGASRPFRSDRTRSFDGNKERRSFSQDNKLENQGEKRFFNKNDKFKGKRFDDNKKHRAKRPDSKFKKFVESKN